MTAQFANSIFLKNQKQVTGKIADNKLKQYKNMKKTYQLSAFFIIAIAFIFLSACSNSSSSVITYPINEDLVTSDIFKIKANGQEIWTEKFLTDMDIESLPTWFTNTPYTSVQQEVHFANFACEGKIKVVIEVPENISSAKVRPTSRGIETNIAGNSLTFEIPGPDKLYIEIDDYPPLCFFADPVETEILFEGQENVIWFGPGTHQAGYIIPSSNQTIYLAPGALVYGGLRIDGVSNIRVMGRGILDGNFEYERMVRLDHSDNIHVEGITIRNGRSWTNTVTNCTNVVYDHVKVVSFGPGGDGVNPLGTSNMTISNSFFRCTDDCIAIKSPQPNHVVRDIFIRNNTMVGFAFSDGVTIGFETRGPSINNIFVENIDILLARGGSRVDGHSGFSIVCDGPSEIYDIFYENIRIEQAEPKLFELIITEGQRYGNDLPGSIRDIVLRNVEWFQVGPVSLEGFGPHNMIRNVLFENCTMAGKPFSQFTDQHLHVNEFVENVKVENF
jgi:hypothetical protein